MRVWYTSFCVRAVVPAMSVKLPGLFPRAYVSTFSAIRPRVFLNIYKIPLRIAALNALVTVLASRLAQASTTFQLKMEEAILYCLLLIINFFMLI